MLFGHNASDYLCKIAVFITNIGREKIYCEYKISTSNASNSCLRESLVLEFVVIQFTFFWILKIISLYGWYPKKNYNVVYN